MAFQAARALGCRVSFIEPEDSSFLAISAADPSRVQPFMRHVDTHLRVPTIQGHALVETLSQLSHQTGRVDALITTSEAAILPVARAAETIGIRTAGSRALERAVFKDRCREALLTAGLRSPDFEVVTEDRLIQGFQSRIPIPFVIKPTRGFGKQFSAVCQTKEVFDDFVKRLKASRDASDPMINLIVNRDYIIESYVTGSLHSCEVVVMDGRVRCYADTTRYRSGHNDLLEMGYSMPSGLPAADQAALVTYVADVFEAIDLRFGLYHVEVLLCADGPCLVEINGRMMGGVGPLAYSAVTGQDAFELLIRLHLGETALPHGATVNRSVTVVLVGARHGGAVSIDFSEDRLEALKRRHGIDFCTLKVAPGMVLGRFDGNVSALGHIIVPGADERSSAACGHQFLQELDELLGVETAKYPLP